MSRFEPLYPAATSPGETAHRFRAKIVASGSAETFRPPRFAEAIPAAHVHEVAETSRMAQPKVTLRRDGDRITHIQIECGCGQIIDLECSY